MARASAGLLLYRQRDGIIEVLLVHPGGPFFRRRDEGAWSIPKGEPAVGEVGIDAALREFEEELGGARPRPPYAPLGSIRQPGGKTVHAWAAEGDFDASRLVSNTFDLEWPPRSGNLQRFPEVDRADWFDMDEARRRLHPAQAQFLDRLLAEVAR